MKERHHIALMAPKGSIGVEIGVAYGDLTAQFMELDHFSAFHAVDKWDDHHNEAEYQKALIKLSGYDNLTVHRAEAKKWLDSIEDGYFGFIYIDCYAHTGQEDGAMLEAAWPKLSEDGLFSGDDYDPIRWPRTVNCVDAFAKEKGYEVVICDEHLALDNNTWGQSPSWYLRK